MRLQKSFDLIVLFLSLQSIIVAKREGDWTIFDLRVLFFFFWENPGKTQERLLSKQELEMTVEIDKKIYLIPWDSQKNKNDTIFFFWISNAVLQQTLAKTSTFLSVMYNCNIER